MVSQVGSGSPAWSLRFPYSPFFCTSTKNPLPSVLDLPGGAWLGLSYLGRLEGGGAVARAPPLHGVPVLSCLLQGCSAGISLSPLINGCSSCCFRLAKMRGSLPTSSGNEFHFFQSEENLVGKRGGVVEMGSSNSTPAKHQGGKLQRLSLVQATYSISWAGRQYHLPTRPSV